MMSIDPRQIFKNKRRVMALLGVLSAIPLAGQTAKPACRQVVLEGDVNAGQGFEKVFTSGLMFMLEPLRSGWIVRVLAANEPRGPHDYAELATPPYQSVSPLLISTDWSFRAQDAVAWNPRRFQYAKDKATFRALEDLQPKAMAGEGAASAQVATLVTQQPQGTLQVLDTRLAPGLANQAGMAAAVASHLAATPHSVDPSATPSPLGKVEELKFRVVLELAPGVHAAPGVREESCGQQPTGRTATASQQLRSRAEK